MFKKLFAPGNDSFGIGAGLLLLRLWLGMTMLVGHGVDKLRHFSDLSGSFPDPFGVGSTGSLALVVFAEVIASIFLITGLVTRFSALVLVINMAVAFFVAHKARLSGSSSGELAFIYMAGYMTLLFTGGGRYSVDKSIFGGGAGKSRSDSGK